MKSATFGFRYHGNSGVKHNRVTDRESGVKFAVFPAALTDDEIRDRWISLGGDPDRRTCGHEHDCCACFFHGAVYVDRFCGRALARQSFGVNI